MVALLVILLGLLIVFIIMMTLVAPRHFYRLLLNTEAKSCGLHRCFIDIGDMKLSLLKNNSSTKQTIVMLHGFSSDKYVFTRFARYFTKQYHVVIPDLAGHGDTGFEKCWDYSGPAHAERIAKLLDKLSVNKVHLVGNSMGGFISTHFAKMYPDRTLSLTLIDPAGIISPQASDMDKMIAQNKNPFEVNNHQDFDDFYAMTMASPPWFPRFVFSVLSQDYQQRKAALMLMFSHFYGKNMLDNNLGDIKAPALLLWGEKDRLIHIDSVSIWQAGITHLKVKTWPDIGHMPMLEIPHKSAKECLNFLNNKLGKLVVT